MCFYQDRGIDAVTDSTRIGIRKKSLRSVKDIQGLQEVYPVDLDIRREKNIDRPWFPIPHEDFEDSYRIDSIYAILDVLIRKHKPTVIFTLDNLVGGYGHPDHVLISQLILKYCMEHRDDETFSIKKIYQLVFPPSQSQGVMKDMEVYKGAREIYGVEGMPLPNVEFDVSPYSGPKKKAMLTYTTEQNSLTQIWPYYNWYPHWIYFKIIDKEYFRIIDVEALPESELFL